MEGDNNIDIFDCKTALLLEVVSQMEKDIRLSGDSHEFKSIEAEGLVNELEDFVNETRQLQNLLYAADVSSFEKPDNVTLNRYLSLQLWNRILKKVMIRNRFKIGNK